MKILVTGAAGRIGGAIVERCEGRHETVAFDMAPPPRGDTIICADVRDREAIFAAATGCDAIIHPAGFHGHQLAAGHSSAEFLEVNLIGVNHLYEAMLHHGIRRMVQSSTMEVVCGPDWLANGAAVLDEGTQPKPDTMYPLSKYLAEQLGPYYLRRFGITTAILRYMNVDTLEPMQAGYQMTARWVWRYDVAEANIRAAEAKAIGCDIIHIGPDTPLSNQDIERSRHDPAAVLERHWPGSVALLERHGIKLLDCLWPVAPIDKAKRLLGWQPEWTFTRYLAELAAAE